MNNILQKSLVLTAISMFLITPARADEDTVLAIGSVALGLIGLAIDANAENKQQEQPAQGNIMQVEANTTPKLQYNKDVEQVQSKLKQVGFYDGAVDGLKGQGTIDAINEWETRYSVESGDGRVNALLSPDELDLLHEQIRQKSTPSKSQKTITTKTIKKATSTKPQIKEIEDLAVVNHIHNICSNYRDLGHSYSFAIRPDLDSNYNKISRLLTKRIKKQASCLDVENVTKLQAQADKAYEQSQDGQIATYGIAMVVSGTEEANKASEYCNMTSGTFLISSRNLEKQIFNADTCKYE